MEENEFEKYKLMLELQLNNDINKNKQKLINSFVDYYGEQYRELITEKFNSITFVYYISDFLIFYILNKVSIKIEKGEDIDFNDVLGLCLYLYKNGLYNKHLTKDNFYKQDPNLLAKRMIGVSNNKVFDNYKLFIQILFIINRKEADSAYEYNLFSEDKKELNPVISLPIFSIDDEALIHEINHAICSRIISTGNDNNCVVQCGLNISNDSSTYKIMELVNDMQARKIYKIFKNKYNGNILTNLAEDSIDIEAEYKKYSIIKFLFKEFEEELKESCISGNLDILFDRLDYNNYISICNIINSNIDEDSKKEQIENIIKSMNKHLKQ